MSSVNPASRDFSTFKFQTLPLNTEDQSDAHRAHCIKFQTSSYVAYVHRGLQNYITEENLERADDSPAMKKARRCVWSDAPGKKIYSIQTKYPHEYAVVHNEMSQLQGQYLKDNPSIWGTSVMEKFNVIDRKYSVQNFIQSFSLTSSNLKKISRIALGIIGISAIFFYTFATIDKN